MAEFFSKAHRHVLESIRDLMVELSAENSAVSFQPTARRSRTGFGVRKMPAFDMTRDGFTLLATSLTGSKAFQFRLRFKAACNEKEAELKAGAFFR